MLVSHLFKIILCFESLINNKIFDLIYRRPGSHWALEQAKYNLVNHYFLVGVSEEMQNFIELLELSLPRFVVLEIYLTLSVNLMFTLNKKCGFI